MSYFRLGRRSSGFTLIELLVVVALIGILAAIVLASLGEARKSSLEAAALRDMRSIYTAMEMLRNDTGLYPHKKSRYCPPVKAPGNEVALNLDSSGLVATDGNYPGWRGPYITDVLDPWGNPYYFDEDYYCMAVTPGCRGVTDPDYDGSAVLVSCGPNGNTGTDPAFSAYDNAPACAYDDDNIVFVLCKK